MGEPVDTSAEAVERLYTGNSARSMEHRGFSTKGLREKLSYTVNPKDWVSAADYDRLQSALTAAQQRIADLEAQCARVQRNAESMRAKLLELAGECAECGGSGLTTIYNYDGNGSDADDQPCPDCADIREAAMTAKEAG